MLPFENFVEIDRFSEKAIYKQIADGIINAIKSGILQPGGLLPGTRALGQVLNVHRKTVIAAYDELYAQSWIEISPRKSVTISMVMPELAAKDWYQLGEAGVGRQADDLGSIGLKSAAKNNRIIVNDGYPDIRLLPFSLIAREYKFSLKRRAVQPQEDPLIPWGAEALRTTLVDYLGKTRGIATQVGNVLVTNGAQMAIFLAASCILAEGDVVVVGSPGYPLANQVFTHLGAKICKVPVNEEGLDLDALKQACQNDRVKLIYCIPHHHYPTTATLSANRRKGLLSLAQQYGITIMEDDFDFDFQYDSSPYLPLCSVKEETEIVYVGSFSKVLSPYIRTGFMVANEQMIKKAAQLRRIINITGDEVMENTIANLINNGDLSRHIKKSVKIYRVRRDRLCNLLKKELSPYFEFTVPDGGMAIWAKLKNGYSLNKAIRVAKSRGINMDGLLISADDQDQGLRLGFASLNDEEMGELIEILKYGIV